jgi:metal-dependent HD superfamily phosphatase/phosphodiesterase
VIRKEFILHIVFCIFTTCKQIVFFAKAKSVAECTRSLRGQGHVPLAQGKLKGDEVKVNKVEIRNQEPYNAKLTIRTAKL